MFDQEDDINLVESDEASADSSPVEQTESNINSSPDQLDTEEAAPAKAEPSAEDKVPFHLHPRFQEIVFQKNQMQEQNKELMRQMQQMQHQFSKLQPPKQAENPLFERLKGIDPEFHEWAKGVESLKPVTQRIEEMEAQLQAAQHNEMRREAASIQDKFYSENKVSPERRELYEAQLNFIASQPQNRHLGVQDLPAVLKQVHEKMNGIFKSVERSSTQKYVETKKSDASKPAPQPKGMPAKHRSKTEPLDRASFVQELQKRIHSDKEI